MEPTNDRSLFINRELSWLAFNERVISEAKNSVLPLHERIKFLAISAANLDEFFMVRVAGLKHQLQSSISESPADGMTPAEQIAAISERVHRMVEDQYHIWQGELRPLLSANGIELVSRDQLNVEQRAQAKAYFQSSVFPVLTPLAVDPSHPFPNLKNKSLNLALSLRRGDKKRRRPQSDVSLAVVQVPLVLPRLVPLAAPADPRFILLEELILLNAAELFPGYTVEGAAIFRLTRNWDLDIDEEESEDLLESVQKELRRRDRGAVVRLELDDGAPDYLETQLAHALNLASHDLYRLRGPLQLQDFTALADVDPRPEHRVETYVPAIPPAIHAADSMFQLIGQKDLLLHHPYESFEPVVRFIEEAAEDPNVLAIKQTLYRTTGDSPIGRALLRASENGKQVTVLVELKARLDEANNIAWARRMENNGIHVVYGLLGLKTHCKVTLVVRRERNGIRRYVHLGTGNYNPVTARLYADLSLFTSRTEIADDATALFNMITGYSTQPQWKRLSVAPGTLQAKILELIARETQKASKGEPARIIAKMNSLVDPDVIRALYEASRAGVDIDLLIRGICCLRPQVPGTSERIRVRSIVDRFLEHARAFVFGAGPNADVFISSADWMPRNFHRRVEVLTPVEDAKLKTRILDEVLGISASDNVKARELTAQGTYVPIPIPADGQPVRSQAVFMELARRSLDTSLRVVAPPQQPESAT